MAHNSLQKEVKENKKWSFLERIKTMALSQGSPLHWGDHFTCHPSKRGKKGLKSLASIPQGGRHPRELTVTCGWRTRGHPAFREYRSHFLSAEAFFPLWHRTHSVLHPSLNWQGTLAILPLPFLPLWHHCNPSKVIMRKPEQRLPWDDVRTEGKLTFKTSISVDDTIGLTHGLGGQGDITDTWARSIASPCIC